MKVTFANWGNYNIPFKTLFEGLGLEVILPERNNPRDIEEGVKLSPELYCFPLKVNVGNYLSAIKKGADTIFMWENIGGSCRFRYYWMVQEKILREAGFNIKIVNINVRNFPRLIRKITKESGASIWQVLRAFYLAIQKLKFVEELEKKSCYLRPREIIQGQTDNLVKKILDKLNVFPSTNLRDFLKLKKEAKEEISKIKIDKNKKVLKVGLIGEIYTVSDETINYELEKKLGKMGVEAHREMSLSYFLKSGFPWKKIQLMQGIKPYLKSELGGHAADALKEMLDYKAKRFDGVIHLLPFGCMPESTVRPILQMVSIEKKFPLLSISLDEQTAEAGVQTRLEAFIDLMKERRKLKTEIN